MAYPPVKIVSPGLISLEIWPLVKIVPLLVSAYDSGLIQVSDVGSGIVGQPCQFRYGGNVTGGGG